MRIIADKVLKLKQEPTKQKNNWRCKPASKIDRAWPLVDEFDLPFILLLQVKERRLLDDTDLRE